MKKISDSWLAFVIGLLLGLALSLALILIFRELLFDKSYKKFIENMFAPILAGLFTLLGILSALFGVYRNIINQNYIENQRTERRLVAARASLSVSLSELVNICKRHVLLIKRQKKYSSTEVLIMSEYAQEKVKEVIENSNGIIMKKLSNLLACYHTAKNEYESLVINQSNSKGDEKLNKKEIQLIVSWVSLKALTECYFDYARGAEFEQDDDKALNSFQKELEIHSGVDHEKVFLEYLDSSSVKGCKFLDPDYFKNEEPDT